MTNQKSNLILKPDTDYVSRCGQIITLTEITDEWAYGEVCDNHDPYRGRWALNGRYHTDAGWYADKDEHPDDIVREYNDEDRSSALKKVEDDFRTEVGRFISRKHQISITSAKQANLLDTIMTIVDFLASSVSKTHAE